MYAECLGGAIRDNIKFGIRSVGCRPCPVKVVSQHCFLLDLTLTYSQVPNVNHPGGVKSSVPSSTVTLIVSKLSPIDVEPALYVILLITVCVIVKLRGGGVKVAG